MKRKKQFERIDHSKVASASKVLGGILLVGLLFIPFGFAYYDVVLGDNNISKWLGFNIKLYVSPFFLGFQYFFQRIGCTLYSSYKQSNREPVRSIYNSQILRLLYVLLDIGEQENIIEPIYSDWMDERTVALRKGDSTKLFRVDLYYYGWFGWRIWKETRIWRSFRQRHVRSAYFSMPSVVPQDKYGKRRD